MNRASVLMVLLSLQLSLLAVDQLPAPLLERFPGVSGPSAIIQVALESALQDGLVADDHVVLAQHHEIWLAGIQSSINDQAGPAAELALHVFTDEEAQSVFAPILPRLLDLKIAQAKGADRWSPASFWLIEGYLSGIRPDQPLRSRYFEALGGPPSFRQQVKDSSQQAALSSCLWRSSDDWPAEFSQSFGAPTLADSLQAMQRNKWYSRILTSGWASLVSDQRQRPPGADPAQPPTTIQAVEYTLFEPASNAAFAHILASGEAVNAGGRRILAGQRRASNLMATVPALTTLIRNQLHAWPEDESALIAWHLLHDQALALQRLAAVTWEDYPAFDATIVLLAELNPQDQRIIAYRRSLETALAAQDGSAQLIHWLLHLAEHGAGAELPELAWQRILSTDHAPAFIMAADYLCVPLLQYQGQLRRLEVLRYCMPGRAQQWGTRMLGLLDKIEFARRYGRYQP